MSHFDFRIIAALLAIIIAIVGYIPYFRDIFKRKTQPHIYTWLIWSITQGTATVAAWVGGGHLGAISLGLGTLPVLAIFFLCLKYGTKNTTRSDLIFLISALLSIILWWLIRDPLPSLIIVTLIDAIAYVPTIRKTFSEPWSETLFFWGLICFGCLLTLLSNSEYNLLTVPYVAMQTAANGFLWYVAFVRRKKMPKTI